MTGEIRLLVFATLFLLGFLMQFLGQYTLSVGSLVLSFFTVSFRWKNEL